MDQSLKNILCKQNMIFLLLIFIILLIFSLAFNFVSIFLYIVLFFLIGIICCYFASKGSLIEFKAQLGVLSFSACIYFFYSLLVYLDFINQDNSFFVFPDQYHFYEVSDSLKSLSSIWEIFSVTVVKKEHIENEGMHFFTGSFAFLIYKYFGSNSVLLQSFLISSLATFINFFVYKTLRFYVGVDVAFRYALIFSFSSVAFSYAPWILRDIHILLLFSFAFYLIHKKFTFFNLILLIFIQKIILEFRFSSGLAFTFFPLIYVLYGLRNYKYKRLIYFLLIILFFPVLYKTYPVILNSFSIVNGRLDRYSDFTVEAVEASAGFSSIIYNLPSGVKELVIVLFSQMQPFPFWTGIDKVENFIQLIIIMIFGLTGIFWFYCVYVSLLSIVKNFSRIPKVLIFSLIFFVIFLFLNSSNMNVRRIMAVYPIVYVFFVYCQSHLNSSNEKKVRVVSFFIIYLLLTFFYLILLFI